MNCPSCAREMHTDRTFADWACGCGLAGPRDVLEALAARLGPAGVLAEAERLCKAAHVSEVQFIGHQVWLQAAWTEGVCAATLAEAYEELTKGERDG